jgi:hypothetical protein
MIFKPGDTVKCFDAGPCRDLTNGKTYTVKGYNITCDAVNVLDDAGSQGLYLATRFKLDTPAPIGAPQVDTISARHDAAERANPKKRYGDMKPALTLFPSGALVAAAEVMATGAEKYGRANWRDDAVETMTYLDAAMRHMLAYIDGQDNDPESGKPHLAHAMCCMAILLDAQAIGKRIENRPTKGAAAELIAAATKPMDKA